MWSLIGSSIGWKQLRRAVLGSVLGGPVSKGGGSRSLETLTPVLMIRWTGSASSGDHNRTTCVLPEAQTDDMSCFFFFLSLLFCVPCWRTSSCRLCSRNIRSGWIVWLSAFLFLRVRHHVSHSDLCSSTRPVQRQYFTFPAGQHVSIPNVATRPSVQRHQTSSMPASLVQGHRGFQVPSLLRKWYVGCLATETIRNVKMDTKVKIVTLPSQGAVLGHFIACAKCGLLRFPDVEVALSQGEDQTHFQPHLHHLLFAGKTLNTQYKCLYLVTNFFKPLVRVVCHLI